MNEENFSFTADKPCGVCPLAQIQPAVWRRLLRPSFHDRHPFLFWLGLALFVIILSCATSFFLTENEEELTGDCLALVQIRGPIIDVAPTLAWIRKIEKNPEVKGILLRVDSPGGGAAASQEIYAALERVRTKLLIVASMGSVAASGGLMVCMAAERIYANPSTVTGSIGVRMDIPQIQGLMEKLGLGQETLVSAPYKNAASYMKPLTPQDREYLEDVIMNMHDQFVDIVAKGRKMPREEVLKLASGKIFTGQQAIALKLIDVLGGQDEALDWLAAKTGVSADKKLLKPAVETSGWLRLFKLAMKLCVPDNINLESLLEQLKEPSFQY